MTNFLKITPVEGAIDVAQNVFGNITEGLKYAECNDNVIYSYQNI